MASGSDPPGPSHTFNYRYVMDISAGVKLDDILLEDILPADIQWTGGNIDVNAPLGAGCSPKLLPNFPPFPSGTVAGECIAALCNAATDDLVKVETEIGYFVSKVWVTEGIRPGIIAMSHHLGRWRLQEDQSLNALASALVALEETPEGVFSLRQIHGAKAYQTSDPDTARIWWEDVGVHQNIIHAVHPDPVSGMHCWHQKAINVSKAGPEDRNGDIKVDSRKSMQVYRRWLAQTRPAPGPNGLRRPLWFKRPLKPETEAFYIQDDEAS